MNFSQGTRTHFSSVNNSREFFTAKCVTFQNSYSNKNKEYAINCFIKNITMELKNLLNNCNKCYTYCYMYMRYKGLLFVVIGNK